MQLTFLSHRTVKCHDYINDFDTRAKRERDHAFESLQIDTVGAFTLIPWTISSNMNLLITIFKLGPVTVWKPREDWWCCFAGRGNWRLCSHLFCVTQSLVIKRNSTHTSSNRRRSFLSSVQTHFPSSSYLLSSYVHLVFVCINLPLHKVNFSVILC